MQYVTMAIFGLVIGLLARFFYPGAQHMGWIATILLGVGGSFVGGIIGGLINKPTDGQLVHPAGWIMSIVGALVLIFVFHSVLHLV